METFYLILLVPVVVALIARLVFKTSITWPETAVQIAVSCLVLSIVWFAGSYSQTHDTEIWNGEVTNKTRHHDDYVRSYSCRCRQSCSGSGDSRSCHEVCDTCYEDHYTVEWYLDTTIGKVRLKYRDSTSRRVYNEPDPANFSLIARPSRAKSAGVARQIRSSPWRECFHTDPVGRR